MTADTAIESNSSTCNRTLKRTQYELLLLLQVKSDPEKSKCLFQGRSDVRQIRRHIGLTRDQRFDLRDDLRIDHAAISCLGKGQGLGHKLKV